MTRHAIFVSLLFSFVLPCFVLSCKGKAPEADYFVLTESMIRFDKAFIPVLALTNKGEKGPSKKSMTILLGEWAAIHDEISSTYSSDKNLLKKIEEVDVILGLAKGQLNGGEDLKEIHGTLERVKYPFRALRSAKGIDYPLDLIDDYHTTMEEILDLVAGKKARKLTTVEIQDLIDHANLSVEQWKKIRDAQIDYSRYGFNESKVKKLNKKIAVGLFKAEEFLALLEKGNLKGALTATKKMKTYYQDVYLMFGDFERVKKQ